MKVSEAIAPSLPNVRKGVVKANVQITANLNQGTSASKTLDMRFSNWEGGSVDYPTLNLGTSHGDTVRVVIGRKDGDFADTPNLGGIDYMRIESKDRGTQQHNTWWKSPNASGAKVQFYGPGTPEAAGRWWAWWGTGSFTGHSVEGGFVAKKQP